MGFTFDVVPSRIDENIPVSDPMERVKTLAAMKAGAVAERRDQGLVVAADTLVYMNGRIYDKPVDRNDAERMLSELSGRTHEVFTGFCLIEIGGKSFCGVERTRVTFRALKDWEITAYIESGRPMDKAGGYGIQDGSGLFVDRIEGCFYNVVGFPLTQFYEGLQHFIAPDVLAGILRLGE